MDRNEVKKIVPFDEFLANNPRKKIRIKNISILLTSYEQKIIIFLDGEARSSVENNFQKRRKFKKDERRSICERFYGLSSQRIVDIIQFPYQMCST